MTLDEAVINIGDREFSAGLTFVALSRVRTFDGLHLSIFDFSRCESINKCWALIARKAEEVRLQDLDLETQSKFKSGGINAVVRSSCSIAVDEE